MYNCSLLQFLEQFEISVPLWTEKPVVETMKASDAMETTASVQDGREKGAEMVGTSGKGRFVQYVTPVLFWFLVTLSRTLSLRPELQVPDNMSSFVTWVVAVARRCAQPRVWSQSHPERGRPTLAFSRSPPQPHPRCAILRRPSRPRSVWTRSSIS